MEGRWHSAGTVSEPVGPPERLRNDFRASQSLPPGGGLGIWKSKRNSKLTASAKRHGTCCAEPEPVKRPFPLSESESQRRRSSLRLPSRAERGFTLIELTV